MSRIFVVESEAPSGGSGPLRAWPRRDFQTTREDLQPGTLLLVRVAQTEDIERTQELLQARRLRQIACRIWLIVPGNVRLPADLTEADAVFTGRDAEVQAAEHASREFKTALPQSTAAALAQRLATWTPSLAPLAPRLALAAEHDVTVLLTGETGSGKTHLARLLHEFSPRRNHRLVVVPCGAIAPNLVESEFFGHVKGAFTGADRARMGRFAAAGRGTLLLDEIDALSLEQQANLLRIVETGEYEPVGSHTTEHWQGRLIVASNRDLAAEVAAGRFREDLFYRLNVVHFHLPPLRERPDDLPPLIRGLTARFAVKFRKPLRDIAPAVFDRLLSYPWPGNLRQLENTLQAAVLLASGDVLNVDHLPALPEPGKHNALVPAWSTASSEDSNLFRNRELSERQHIVRALARCRGCRAQAARSLGISRVTLYKKMKKYRLLLDEASLAASA